jgi:hypothetical protein
MGGAYILVFVRNGANFGTLVQKDAKEAEMKKRLKIFDSAPSYWT